MCHTNLPMPVFKCQMRVVQAKLKGLGNKDGVYIIKHVFALG